LISSTKQSALFVKRLAVVDSAQQASLAVKHSLLAAAFVHNRADPSTLVVCEVFSFAHMFVLNLLNLGVISNVVPNVLGDFIAGTSVHIISGINRAPEVPFFHQRGDLAIVASVLVIDTHTVGVRIELNLAHLQHIVTRKINQLDTDIVRGVGLFDLHRGSTMADF